MPEGVLMSPGLGDKKGAFTSCCCDKATEEVAVPPVLLRVGAARESVSLRREDAAQRGQTPLTVLLLA